MTRTEEILQEISLTPSSSLYPEGIATYLARLEARVEVLEPGPQYAEFGGKHYKWYRNELWIDGTKAFPKEQEAPKESASWEDRFDKEFVPSGIDSEDDDAIEARVGKFKAFIAEEKKKSYEDGFGVGEAVLTDRIKRAVVDTKEMTDLTSRLLSIVVSAMNKP